MLRVPSGLVTTRELTLAGVAVPAGTVLDSLQMDQIGDLQALVARGWIAPTQDIYGRKTRLGNPQPTYLPPVVLNAMREAAAAVVLGVTATVDPANDRRFTVAITGGNGPYSLAWGDGASSNVQGSSSTHTFADYSTWIVTVTDANGADGTATITAVDPGI